MFRSGEVKEVELVNQNEISPALIRSGRILYPLVLACIGGFLFRGATASSNRPKSPSIYNHPTIRQIQLYCHPTYGLTIQ